MSLLRSSPAAPTGGHSFWAWLRLALARSRRGALDETAVLAGALASELEFTLLDDSLEVKAFLAVRPRYIRTYRGFCLYASDQERVVLMERQLCRYVQAVPSGIVLLGAVEQALRFVDALLILREQDPATLHAGSPAARAAETLLSRLPGDAPAPLAE